MRLYLYLARRDRTGITMISIFETPREVMAIRLEAASRLGLPTHESTGLQKMFDENRMNWEPWIETAEDYEALKRSLEGRGYKNVPVSCRPAHSSYAYTDPYVVDARFKQTPTMLRRATP